MKSTGQIFTFSILKSFTVIVFVINSLALIPAHAQLFDDFADNDFDQNPAWSGSASSFVIENGMLRLTASSSETMAYLSTPQNILGNTVWEFLVNLDFNPSSTNYTRVFVAADTSYLNGSLNGYFIMIGNTSDEISLYRQNGNTRTKIIDGPDGRVNSSSVSVRVRLTRSSDGQWELSSMLAGETSFVPEGSTTDTSHLLTRFFGIQCVFTSTRTDRFYFDDFSIRHDPAVDNEPPGVRGLDILNKYELRIRFSEPISEGSLANETFAVSPDIGHPKAAFLTDNGSTALLTFATAFRNGATYRLSVASLFDLAGNESNPYEQDFRYVEQGSGGWKDVVVTEILADPSPVVGLPESEFIEILNRSPYEFSLAGWTVTDGSSTGKLASSALLPGEYAILAPTGSSSLFTRYGKVVPVSAFPSLNNAGDLIVLRSAEGTTIDSLAYSDKWYRDNSKKQGGWSLELIDPENICSGESDWVASEHEAGGTPGAQNSVNASKPDLTAPILLQALPIRPDSLVLRFNEALERSIPSPASFAFKPFTEAREVRLSPDRKEIHLRVDPEFVPRVSYTLLLSNIRDCPGNLISPSAITAFALPEPADSLDVIINEILFNPRGSGSDFVEIYNRSDKYIDLGNWTIANCDQSGIRNRKVVGSGSFLIKPGTYVAFTPDPQNIMNEYIMANSEQIFQQALPPLNNSDGTVCLIDNKGQVIDLLRYHEGMHSPFVRDPEGVSLERISPAPIAASENWRSASSVAGFATPGYRNSNWREEVSGTTKFRVVPEAFIPQQGNPDFAMLEYQLNQPNTMATIRILDARGRTVRTITENTLLGTSGFFRWDGDDDSGMKVRIGAYLILLQLYNETGETEVIRRRVVVAGRF
jgi:hypothetical protein